MAQYEYRDGKYTGRELLSEEEHQKKQFLPIALALGLILLVFGGIAYLFGLILPVFKSIFKGIANLLRLGLSVLESVFKGIAKIRDIPFLYIPLKIIFWVYVIFSLIVTTIIFYDVLYKK